MHPCTVDCSNALQSCSFLNYSYGVVNLGCLEETMDMLESSVLTNFFVDDIKMTVGCTKPREADHAYELIFAYACCVEFLLYNASTKGIIFCLFIFQGPSWLFQG